MKDVKCKNCGASFKPADKFCSYCKSARPGGDEKTLQGSEKQDENKSILDDFKNMGLNSSVLNNIFGSIFDD